MLFSFRTSDLRCGVRQPQRFARTSPLPARPCGWALAVAAWMLFLSAPSASAGESPPVQRPGLDALQLVTEAESIAPGETITVGLRIEPAPGFHTYWKHPGIVGVPVGIEWSLPEGFEASPVRWPAPVRTEMASLTAWGYREETCLLVDITAPPAPTETSASLKAKVTWMACARTCHPGSADLSLSLPVGEGADDPEIPPSSPSPWTALIESSRERVPPPAPGDWTFSVRENSPASIILTVTPPSALAGALDGIYFYSYDNQVDSDEPQAVKSTNRGASFALELVRPEFAPEDPEALAGVLHRPGGWPGTGSPWMEISVPWESSTREPPQSATTQPEVTP